jgi:hypothetical protein
MAFLSLDALRTGYLNNELGLASDADTNFGTEAQRNFYLQNAIRKLWPAVARLVSESITVLANDQTYTLTAIEDVERIEILDISNDQIVANTVRSWQVIRDESADPAVNRLIIPPVGVGYTLRVIGYAAYTVPASSPPSGSANVDFPTRMAHVVSAGGRVEAYRAKLNKFADYEQFANENRQNVLQPAELLELLRQAEREFERLQFTVRRDFAAPKRARTQTR